MTNQNNDDIDDEEDTLRKIKEFLQSPDVLNEPSPNINEDLRRYMKDFLPREIESTLEEMQPKKNEMGKLLTVVRDYLQSTDWDFFVDESMTYIGFHFEGHNGRWQFMIQTREDHEQIIFYSNFEGLQFMNDAARDAAIGEMMKFITRVNYRLVVGNFELDLSDGEVNYKTAIDCDDTCVSPEMIRNLLHTNLATFDKHLPGLEAILDGASAEEALSKVAKPTDFEEE